MALALVCCGCRKMLGPNGETVDIRPALESLTFNWSMVADFPDKKSADEAARKADWRAENGDHRCLDCVNSERFLRGSTRRAKGAYVEWGADQHCLYADGCGKQGGCHRSSRLCQNDYDGGVS